MFRLLFSFLWYSSQGLVLFSGVSLELAWPRSRIQRRSPAPLRRLATIRIEPPSGLFELRLREVWAYRELLYFFVWRDVKIRYKQTAIGVLWVVLQPVLNMLVFTLFFGRLAKLPPTASPIPSSTLQLSSPGPISPTPSR